MSSWIEGGPRAAGIAEWILYFDFRLSGSHVNRMSRSRRLRASMINRRGSGLVGPRCPSLVRVTPKSHDSACHEERKCRLK